MKWANISIERGSENNNADRVINLGDYAQLLAIDNIYSDMGIDEEEIVRIEYRDLWDYDGESVVLPFNFIFFNPYNGVRPFIFSKKVIPVFMGVNLVDPNYTLNELLYLVSHSPVGCRNEESFDILSKKGISAYLQGCITATFPLRGPSDRQKDIYIVDIPGALEPYIPEEIKNSAKRVSQQYYGKISDLLGEKNVRSIRDLAKEQYNMYRDTAALVITGRLHCAAPCIAMGIPTIIVAEELDSSFAWVERLTTVYTKEKYSEIDWDPAPVFYEEYKERIKESVISRLKDTMQKNAPLCDISDWYCSRDRLQYENSYITRLKQYAKENWNREDKFSYAIWGITGISEVVCSWMEDNFPRAKLIAVVDEYRDITFHGIQAVRSSELDKYSDVFVIATGDSASIAAQKKYCGSVKEKMLCTVFGNRYKDV